MTSLLFCRYDDELNKRSEAENDFMVLKKVSRPAQEEQASTGLLPWHKGRGGGGIFPGMRDWIALCPEQDSRCCPVVDGQDPGQCQPCI